MKKISIIFGTRPEAIKMAPLIAELRQTNGVELSVCLTGQHKEMVWQVLDFFQIKPDHEFDLMTSNQSLAGFTSKALATIDQYLESEQPDLVLVQGDTATVMATSIACYFRRIDLGHVEAGLRSGSFEHPFPEEFNRVVTGLTTRLHFAPTDLARTNLLNGGVGTEKIFVTGNTVIDALYSAVERIADKPPLIPGISELPKKFILVTGHRRESFGEGLQSTCEALRDLVREHEDLSIIYPVHLNPNVQKPVHDLLGDESRIHLIPPVDYAAMVYLMQNCHLVISDSGGIQEEAPALGKPVLVTRETTERPEGIEAGTAKLVGTGRDTIVREANILLNDEAEWNRMSQAHNPYGDGTAAKQIVRAIQEFLDLPS